MQEGSGVGGDAAVGRRVDRAIELVVAEKVLWRVRPALEEAVAVAEP